jgi:hypothetical protein
MSTAYETGDDRDSTIAALLDVAWIAWRRRDLGRNDPALADLRSALDVYRDGRAPEEKDRELPPLRDESGKVARGKALRALMHKIQDAIERIPKAREHGEENAETFAKLAASVLIERTRNSGLASGPIVTKWSWDTSVRRISDELIRKDQPPALKKIAKDTLRACGLSEGEAEDRARAIMRIAQSSDH